MVHQPRGREFATHEHLAESSERLHLSSRAKWAQGERLRRICSQSLQSCPLFVTPWTVASQAPLSMGFPRQEYWSGLPFPPPGDLLDPGIKPTPLMSPALAGGFFTTSATWEAHTKRASLERTHLTPVISLYARTESNIVFKSTSRSSTEKAMATQSSALAWKIPWTEEPGRLQSMGSHRIGHKWVTSLSLFTFMHWRRKWQPTPVFLPGEFQGRQGLAGCHLWGHRESDTTEAT